MSNNEYSKKKKKSTKEAQKAMKRKRKRFNPTVFMIFHIQCNLYNDTNTISDIENMLK
jgi:hypothetical protein